MTYTVYGEADKIAGTLNTRAHLVDAIDPELQDVFVEMVAKGITEIIPIKTSNTMRSDKVTTTAWKDATPEQIVSELVFQGFRVVPEGASTA